MAALSARVAQPHAGERAAGGVEADRVRRLVPVPDQRWRLRCARDRGRPAERRRHEVVHGQARPRPLLPHGRHREPHQPREGLPQRLALERGFVAPPVLDEQVGPGEQISRPSSPARSSAATRLPALYHVAWIETPLAPKKGGSRSSPSPPAGAMRTTSAPPSASSLPVKAPAQPACSTTRSPASGVLVRSIARNRTERSSSARGRRSHSRAVPLPVPRVKLRLYVLRVFLPSPRLAVALGLFIVAIVGGTVGYPPCGMGARRMAFAALWPAAVDTVDTIESGGGQGLVFAELKVDGLSGAVGASCGDLLAGTSATLLGVRTPSPAGRHPHAPWRRARHRRPRDALLTPTGGRRCPRRRGTPARSGTPMHPRPGARPGAPGSPRPRSSASG